MKKILEIRSLDFSYHTLTGETKAVENISFDVLKMNLSVSSDRPAAENPPFCR